MHSGLFIFWEISSFFPNTTAANEKKINKNNSKGNEFLIEKTSKNHFAYTFSHFNVLLLFEQVCARTLQEHQINYVESCSCFDMEMGLQRDEYVGLCVLV